jgi:ABC-2 type transport system ATP-binding protein
MPWRAAPTRQPARSTQGINAYRTLQQEATVTVYLSAAQIEKSYRKKPVLKGVSLELLKGEILALLGPNGCGKTTFIKILATLLIKDRGRVEIMGYDLDKHVNKIRHLFGYVGQDSERSAYARLTVRENLHFFGSLHGLSDKTLDAQIDKLMYFFDFEENINKNFGHLSGGQKQTMVIMRALLYNPPIVYLDEPTKGLDPLVAKKIRAYLKRYVKEEQKSLLLTSHILPEVDELADRVALMDNGVIPVVSTPTRLKQDVGVQSFIEIPRSLISPQIKDEIMDSSVILRCNEREANWWSFGVNDVLDGTETIIAIMRKHQIQPIFRNYTVSLEDAFVHHIGALSDRFDK